MGNGDNLDKRLIELLRVLIAWNSAYCEEFIGPVVGPVREQHEVVLILEEHPALAAGLAIEYAIERARQAIAKPLPPNATPPRRYTLAELLVPPLTAFSPAGATEMDISYRGDWDEIEEPGPWILGDLGTPRLGKLIEAWLRDGDGDSVEVIEFWVVKFPAWREERGDAKAECWYRYRSDRPDEGQVYSSENMAFSGQGGLALSEALTDGLAHGLVIPDDAWGES